MLKKLVFLLLFSFCCFFAFGCGGDGGSTGGGSITSTLLDGSSNPLAGNYYGSWNLSSSPRYSGTIFINISSGSILSGSLYNTSVNDSAMLTGTITSAGVFTATYSYVTNGGTGSLSGTLISRGASAYANFVDSGQYQGRLNVTKQ